MSYDKKIQMIESNIAELEGEMEILSTRQKEHMDTTAMIMLDIAKDVKKNREIYENTKKKIEEEKKKKGKGIKKIEEDVDILKNKVTTVEEKIRMVLPLQKKAIQLRLEKLRLQSEIIGKISPETSKLIDSDISKLEKIELEYVKKFDGFSTDDGKFDEFMISMEELTKKSRQQELEINTKITISRNCIKNSIDLIKTK